MDDLELVFFKMISSLGSARSSFMEAMALARTGDFAQAQAAIEQGKANGLPVMISISTSCRRMRQETIHLSRSC